MVGDRLAQRPVRVAGWFERLTTPAIMRSIYRKEFRNLQAYLDQRQAQAA